MKSDPENPQSLSYYFRKKRAKLFNDYIISSKGERLTIIDLGGTEQYWRHALLEFGEEAKRHVQNIIILNLPPLQEKTICIGDIKISVHEGDATDLRCCGTQSADMVFSNSVIEHVGDLGFQKKMANEILRIGKDYFIQTPNKYFPIEPHFYFPFYALLPLWLRSLLHRKFSLGFMGKAQDELTARITCERTRLLNETEIQLLFPKSHTKKEKVLGLTKSFVITKRCVRGK